MKKFLSIVLCLALVLSLSIVAFAADNEGTNVVVGENEIEVPMYAPEGGRIYTEFTAEVSGLYIFTCTTPSADGAIRVGGTDWGIPWLFEGDSWEVTLAAGESVTICVYSYHSYEYAYGVTFTVELVGGGNDDGDNKPEVELELGDNALFIPLANADVGLLCAFTAPATGTYLLTVKDDNAYILCGNQELDEYGETAEFYLVEGQYQEILIGTYDMQPDTIDFNISVLGAVDTELELGDNDVYVPADRALHGLECTFVAEIGGLYEITLLDENGMVYVNTWLKEDITVTQVSLRAGQTLDIDVATYDGESDHILLNITLVREHEYEAVVTAPTCDTQGYTTYTCIHCGDVYKADYTSATREHVYETETERQDATCTEDGYVIMACQCGETQTTVLPAGHTAGEAVRENEVSGDCTTNRSYDLVVYCTVCGEELSRETVTEAAGGHEITSSSEGIDATCTEDGVIEYYYCGTCGCYFADAELTTLLEDQTGLNLMIPATGHEITASNEGIDATCTEDGILEYYYCGSCGCYFADAELTTLHEDQTGLSLVIPALGHEIVSSSTGFEATCTEDGIVEYYYCGTCGCYFADAELTTLHEDQTGMSLVIPAYGHEITASNAGIDATCTEDGILEYYYCGSCGCYFADAELTTLHEDQTGLSLVIPALGHEIVSSSEGIDPTCMEEGIIEYYYCGSCGCYFADAELTTLLEDQTGLNLMIPTIDHIAGEAVKENEVIGNCIVDTTYELATYCATCGVELSRETVSETAAGHIAGEAVKENEVPASCNTDGSYDLVVRCTICGEEMSRQTVTVIATGDHVFAYETERLDATCTEDGYVTMACGCGETETTVLPATGHEISFSSQGFEPTCAEEGMIEFYYCGSCGCYFADAELTTLLEDQTGLNLTIPAYGHEIVASNAGIDATCTEDGIREYYYCGSCGCYFADAELTTLLEDQTGLSLVIPALGHEIVSSSTGFEATCTEDGIVEYYYCGSCGCYFADAELTTLHEDQTGLNLTIPAYGHEITASNAGIDATCTEDGIREYYYCGNCGCYFADAELTTLHEDQTGMSLVIPALGHEIVSSSEGFDATCGEDGIIEYYYCGSCGCYFADAELTTLHEDQTGLSLVIPALGHEITASNAGIDATCTEDGIREYYYCGNCCTYFADAELTTELEDQTGANLMIPATGHTEGEWVVVKEASKTETGLKQLKCAVCGEVLAEEVIPALDDSPITGDNMILFVIFALMAVTGAAVVIAKKKYF